MKLSYIDASNYMRGLLVLIRKDNIIHKNEKSLMLKIGSKLGFDGKMYENAVDEFLSKKKIDDSPPKFSSKKITLKFIEEAIHMAYVDNYFHIKEFDWLKEIGKANKIPQEKINEKINNYLEQYPNKPVFKKS